VAYALLGEDALTADQLNALMQRIAQRLSDEDRPIDRLDVKFGSPAECPVRVYFVGEDDFEGFVLSAE
jgi:hypothetical protein